jgi:IclR family acetate operon transcriptional repressor
MAVAAVAKAAALLRAYGPAVDVMSVRQLAARTGIPPSTVHSIVVTLCSTGLLDVVPGRGYRLGSALVGLAGPVIERTGLVAAVEGAAGALLRVPGQEMHVGQLVGAWVVYLHRETGRVRAPMDNRVGLRAPAWRGGCGKAALSRLPDAEVDSRIGRLCEEEGTPLPDLSALHAELDSARRDGWLTSTSFQRGRTSVAAPVVDATGRPVGGLSVAGPDALFTRDVVRRLGPDIAEAAARAGRRLDC